jgi:hypothetical protein
VWERVQQQYVSYLSDWRTDLGGKKNFHNSTGDTYDCISLMSYYTVCKAVTKLILHWSFVASEKKCNAWHDYEMSVAPYEKGKPIYYEFTACPIAEFAKQHDLLEVMPAMCNPDYAAMELLHARLVRTTTCADGCKCDYTICGDRDEYLKEHPEYVDEAGFRRNT